MSRPLVVEVCVEGIASALAAYEGGADRVELCENLAVGGVTPSAGTIAVVCRRLSIPVHVLIRPRAGDFVYSDDELSALRHDVATARSLGAAGVVCGFLRADQRVDIERTAEFVALAAPLSVTFHRAFDETPEPFEGLDTLIGLGVDRILTAGHAATAAEGIDELAALTERAEGKLAILAGGRIRKSDLAALRARGVREVHTGSAVQAAGVTGVALVRDFVEEARRSQRG